MDRKLLEQIEAVDWNALTPGEARALMKAYREGVSSGERWFREFAAEFSGEKPKPLIPPAEAPVAAAPKPRTRRRRATVDAPRTDVPRETSPPLTVPGADRAPDEGRPSVPTTPIPNMITLKEGRPDPSLFPPPAGLRRPGSQPSRDADFNSAEKALESGKPQDLFN